MLDEATRQLIISASDELELPPTVVEKDYYVTRILSTLESAGQINEIAVRNDSCTAPFRKNVFFVGARSDAPRC